MCGVAAMVGISFDFQIIGKTFPTEGLMAKTVLGCWQCQRRPLSRGSEAPMSLEKAFQSRDTLLLGKPV